MKKTILGLLVILSMYLQSNAQENSNCNGGICCHTNLITPTNGDVPLSNCGSIPMSSAFHLRHKHVTSYIPDNSSTNIGIKTIRINIIIVGVNEQYPLVWEDDPALYHFWMEFPFSGVIPHQFCYVTPPPPNPDACNCPTPLVNNYLPDSKIRIEVVNVRYYSDANGELANCNNAAKRSELIEMHLTDFPEDIQQLNWYITKDIVYSTGVGGYVETHNEGGYSNIPYIHSGYGNLPYSGQWDLLHRHFPHELGHILNIDHTYQGGASNYSINIIDGTGFQTAPYEHLDDVFSGQSTLDVWDGGHSFAGCNNIMGGGLVRWTSPKQMGRMHRSLSMIQTYTPSAMGNFLHARNYVYGYSDNPLIVQQNETWDFTYKSYSDIVVKRGATLIIKCRLEMVPQAKIVVEPGGRLIVDGGIITSAFCGGPDQEGLWRGIEVWGQDAYNQITLAPDGFSYQGKVEVINGAIIEHAQVAIQANRPGTSNSGGGIIIVENSSILNSWKGLHFTRYQGFSNISRIEGSLFEVNDDWKMTNNPVNFIEGWNFRNATVQSNTFINNNERVAMNGIYLETAGMNIAGVLPASVETCDYENQTWLANKFVNLNHGILGVWLGAAPSGAGIGFTPTIRKNQFENCNYSIVNRGMPNFIAENNYFQLGDDNLEAPYNIGIYQIGGVNYVIQDNCMEQTGTPANTSPIGIVIFNTGGDDHRVQRNKMYDVDYAFLAMNKNKTAGSLTNPSGTFYKGLQFSCNQNNGQQIYDFSITSVLNQDPMTGIRYLQGGNGFTNQPSSQIQDAGNIFSHTCDNSEADYYNGVINPFVYFHAPTAPKTPDCYSTAMISTIPITGLQNQCTKGIILTPNPPAPPLPDGRAHISTLISDYMILNSQFLATAIVYNAVIDNGDPQSLLQYIYPNSDMSATDIRLALLNVSPNISRDNMALLVKENTLLTNQDLLQIIASNPDLAHDEELLKMLIEKANPMDEWMINFLRYMGTYTTDRTTLEWMFANKSTDRNLQAWEIVHRLIEDDSSFTQIYEWLDIIGTPGAIYLKAEDMAARNNFSGAYNAINSINASKLDRWEIMEHQGMLAWIGLLENLHNSNRNIYQLDSTELEALRVYANDYVRYGKIGVYAKNVLNVYEPDMHHFELVLPEPNRSRHADRRELKPLSTMNEIAMSAFPNPAQRQVTIEFSEKIESGTVNLYSVTGEKLLSVKVENSIFVVIDVTQMPQGVYVAVLANTDGEKISETKISVQR